MSLHTLLFAILSTYRTIEIAFEYSNLGDDISDCYMIIGMYKVVTLFTAYEEKWLEYLLNEAPVYVIEHLLKQHRFREALTVCLLLLLDWKRLSTKVKVITMSFFVYNVPSLICKAWKNII